jgi:hypothetical protein
VQAAPTNATFSFSEPRNGPTLAVLSPRLKLNHSDDASTLLMAPGHHPLASGQNPRHDGSCSRLVRVLADHCREPERPPSGGTDRLSCATCRQADVGARHSCFRSRTLGLSSPSRLSPRKMTSGFTGSSLRESYPASAEVFMHMAEEESDHRRTLLNLLQQRSRDHIPLVSACLSRQPG